jgi:hypothetical protein
MMNLCHLTCYSNTSLKQTIIYGGIIPFEQEEQDFDIQLHE